MRVPVSASLLVFPIAQVLASPVTPRANAPSPVNVTTCNGQKYVYEELAGFGKLPSNARDKYGETIGGFGSSIAVDKKSFKKSASKNGSYTGILYGLPDRGWNTQGTLNTQNRIHKFAFTFDVVQATIQKPSAPNFQLTYVDTLLLSGPDGTPMTGIDATDVITYDGFPDLPLAKCKSLSCTKSI